MQLALYIFIYIEKLKGILTMLAKLHKLLEENSKISAWRSKEKPISLLVHEFLPLISPVPRVRDLVTSSAHVR